MFIFHIAQTPYNCYETIRDGQRKRIYEAILPDHTFHLEYNLLPSGHESMRFKTDVVTFGVVCKVHTDKDSRVIKAWEENGLMYYAWRHRYTGVHGSVTTQSTFWCVHSSGKINISRLFPQG